MCYPPNPPPAPALVQKQRARGESRAVVNAVDSAPSPSEGSEESGRCFPAVSASGGWLGMLYCEPCLLTFISTSTANYPIRAALLCDYEIKNE